MSVSETSAAAPTASVAAVVGGRPYAPSWLDLLLGWLDRLPGPRFLAYGAVAAVFIVISNAALWSSELLAFPELDAAQTFWGVYLPVLLVTIHHLDVVARRAFDEYRPALGAVDASVDELRYRLTVVPARPAAAIALLAVPVTLSYYVADPVGSQITGYSAVAVMLRGVGEVLSSAIILTLVYHTIRQLGLVMRLHAMAREVDIFQPRPLYAFSRLTARTGAALIVFMMVPVLVVQPAVDAPNFWLLWAPWLIGIPVVGAAVFLVPLLGMHDRLLAEKERLLTEADERMRSLLADLNVAVDQRELQNADALQKLLAAHQAQLDVLGRLPTWPWATSTLRGFASALLLPVILFLIQRYLGDLLSR